MTDQDPSLRPDRERRFTREDFAGLIEGVFINSEPAVDGDVFIGVPLLEGDNPNTVRQVYRPLILLSKTERMSAACVYRDWRTV